MASWKTVDVRYLIVGSICAVALGACVTAVPRAQKFDEGLEISKLATGKSILLQGRPDVAIRDYFDPIIQDYQKHFSRSGELVYSANTTTEVLLYSALGATTGKSQAKIASTSKIIVLNGVWADALELKGYALVDLKRDDDAAAVLKRAVSLAPFNPTSWTELGFVYQREKNWAAAMDAYQQAENGAELIEDEKETPTRPLLARALRGQGYVLTELGKLAEAKAIYLNCLQLNPDDARAKHELAYIGQLEAQKAVPAKADPAAK